MINSVIDIKLEHLDIVLEILEKWVPEYEVWVFGSRIKGTAKPYSDLDLCIRADKPLSFSVLGGLSEDFSESDLPWKVDVLDWSTTSPEFREIIAKDKIVLKEIVKK